MIREFFTGVRMLGRGFGFWKVNPHLMLLGLIPAVITFVLLVAALIPLGFALGPLTEWATPFADGWADPWRMLFRIGIGAVIGGVALGLAVIAFTAIALAIGDPFYQRIWKGVERHLGDEPTGSVGFWASFGESIRLIVLGILVALLTLVIGFIPVIGGPVAAVTGVLLSGRLLARELAGRAFDARGISTLSRSQMLGISRARVLGFGAATQLCFMVPLGAVIVMPAAVAGSTMLVRSLLARAAGTLPPGAPGVVPGTTAPGSGAGSAPGVPPAPGPGATPGVAPIPGAAPATSPAPAPPPPPPAAHA